MPFAFNPLGGSFSTFYNTGGGGGVPVNGPFEYYSTSPLTDTSNNLYYSIGTVLADNIGDIFYSNGDILADSTCNLYYPNNNVLSDNFGNLYYSNNYKLADNNGILYYGLESGAALADGGALNYGNGSLLSDSFGSLYSSIGLLCDLSGNVYIGTNCRLTPITNGVNIEVSTDGSTWQSAQTYVAS
jgi:hypothetical protein